MVHCLTMCSVVKFYTSEVRLSKRWNGSTTASIWWIIVDNSIYIFGGSEIYRLPYIHLMQNNSAPMDRNKNSIQMGYQCKNPFVCCLFIFFYIFVSRSFPLPSAFLSTDIERGKVFGLNTLRRRKIQTETACRPDLSTFKGWCTTFADEQRKGANDGIEKLIYRRLMIDQIQILPRNNEKCTVLLLVYKKVVPLFQDELYINANHASM